MENNKSSEVIAIIGGGLSGLALGLGLAQSGVQVEVFEKRLSQESTTGRELPIIINHRGLRALKRMGVDYRDHPEFASYNKIVYWMVDGENISKMAENPYLPHDQNSFVRRLNLWHIFMKECAKYPEITVHIGATYKEISFEDGTIEFEDGKKSQYAFIFACDGVYSAIRDEMIKQSGYNYVQNYDGYAGVACEINEPILEYGAMNQVILKNSVIQGQIGPKDENSLVGIIGFQQQGLEESGLGITDFLKREMGEYLFSKCVFPDATKISIIHERVSVYPWVYKKVMVFGDAANAQGPHAGLGLNIFLDAVDEIKDLIKTENKDWVKITDYVQKKYFQDCLHAWKLVFQLKEDGLISTRGKTQQRNFIWAMLRQKYADKFCHFHKLAFATRCPVPIIYDIIQKGILVAQQISQIDGFQKLLQEKEQQEQIVKVLEQYLELFQVGNKYYDERDPLFMQKQIEIKAEQQ